MSDKPANEVELSPLVIAYFKALGYCVHGEVAIFKKSTFIDHVAHLGPCDNPTYVVGIEMKQGAGKNLRNQMFHLDTYHVADELWGVSITRPREDTLEAWETWGRWYRPGLLVWTPDSSGLEKVCDFGEHRAYKRKMNRKNLLLFGGNKDCLAGYPSGGTPYHTHWSVTKNYIENNILGVIHEPLGVEDIMGRIPHNYIGPYKRKKSAVQRILKSLIEEDNKAQMIKVAGTKQVLYKMLRQEGEEL